MATIDYQALAEQLRDKLLQVRLDELTASHSSEVLLNIKDAQIQHEKDVRKAYGRFCRLFEACYETLIEAIYGINYVPKKHWPEHRALQFALLANNVSPLHGAYECFLKGAYEDSICLMRVPYETFIRIVWVSCHPDGMTRHAVLVYKPPAGVKQFNVTDFVKRELGLDWLDYSIMSVFEHSNQIAVFDDLKEMTSGKQSRLIAPTYGFDETLAGVAMNYIYFVMIAYMGFITDVLRPKSAPPNMPQDRLDNLIKLRELLRDISISHPKVYRQRATEDMESLLYLIKRTDEGSKWEEVWTRRRLIDILRRVEKTRA